MMWKSKHVLVVTSVMLADNLVSVVAGSKTLLECDILFPVRYLTDISDYLVCSWSFGILLYEILTVGELSSVGCILQIARGTPHGLRSMASTLCMCIAISPGRGNCHDFVRTNQGSI